MPKIYGTRFWGFSPEDEPFVAFLHEGTRDRLVRTAQPGDMIVVLGTKTNNTAPEDQGRLLGLVEFAHTSVFADDLISDRTLSKSELFENGKFKWPYALPAVRSWRFPDKPLVEDVIGRQLSMAAITDVDELTDTEAEAVLNLNRAEAVLPETRAIRRVQRLGSHGRVGDQHKGGADPVIPPSEWSRVVSRTDGPTYAYVFQYGETNVWKVGISKNISERLLALNFSIPDEITESQWKPIYEQLFENGSEAFDMEQAVLSALGNFRTRNERVMCSLSDIEREWFAYLSGA